MKLTWFGASALRLHYGGQIVVLDAARARDVEPAELVSGADRVIGPERGAIALFDGTRFVPPRPRRVIDIDDEGASLQVYRFEGGLLLASSDEPILVVLDGHGTADWGAWADGAVIVVAHEAALDVARAALGAARLRLVALALDPDRIAPAADALRPALGRAGLMDLEEGLALEI